MSYFIKTGFWTKAAKAPEGYLNLDRLLSVLTQVSTPILTPGAFDGYRLGAQAEPLLIANPPTDYADFDGFMLELTDNGVAQAITFDTKFRGIGDALPTTTTPGKVMVITAIRSSPLDKYNVSWKNQP